MPTEAHHLSLLREHLAYLCSFGFPLNISPSTLAVSQRFIAASPCPEERVAPEKRQCSENECDPAAEGAHRPHITHGHGVTIHKFPRWSLKGEVAGGRSLAVGSHCGALRCTLTSLTDLLCSGVSEDGRCRAGAIDRMTL